MLKLFSPSAPSGDVLAAHVAANLAACRHVAASKGQIEFPGDTAFCYASALAELRDLDPDAAAELEAATEERITGRCRPLILSEMAPPLYLFRDEGAA